MKKTLSLLAIAILGIGSLKSQQITFQTAIDRDVTPTSSDYEMAHCIKQTPDNGYIVVGETEYTTISFPKALLVVKLDEYGDTLWSKMYAGTGDDVAADVIKTSDGGYAIVGSTTTPNGSTTDAFLIKITSTGVLEWSKYYGGSGAEKAYEVLETSTGYIMVCTATSYDTGYGDVLIIATDAAGNQVWTQIYGEQSYEAGRGIVEATDGGGYVITGEEGENDYGVLLMKIDLTGNIVWQKSIRRNIGTNEGWDLTATSDGGYAITGNTNDGGIGGSDIFIIKTDVNGNIQWNRTFGKASYDYGLDVIEVTSGGYLVTSTVDINSEYILTTTKLDANGNIEWNRGYRGPYGQMGYWEANYNAVNTSDGGFALIGDIYNGFVVDGTSDYNGYDMFIVKTDSMGRSLGCQVDITVIDSVPTLTAYTNTLSTPVVAIVEGDLVLVETDPDIRGTSIEIHMNLIASPVTCGASCDGVVNIDLCNTFGWLCSGTGPYTYEWSDGSTLDSLDSACPGTYSVTVTDFKGCRGMDSVTVVTGAPEQSICFVTVDSTSQYNVIMWSKPVTDGIDYFKIYRRITGNYYLVDSVSYDSLSQYVDTTNGVDPNTQSYRYKMSTVDTCGNESAMSDFHETIHLQTGPGSGNDINLSWDNYEGFGFTYYRIWRDSTDLNDWELMDSTDIVVSTQWTDINPPSVSSVRYLIEVVPPGPCNVWKASSNYNSSRSNTPAISGNPTQPLASGFSASATSILAGTTITFSDNTTGAPTSWAWEFDGGTPSTSVQQNPGVTYNTAGSYRVKLVVSDGTNSDSLETFGYITVLTNNGQAPAAQFIASSVSIIAGNSINFTDISSNNPTSWTWVFMNGNPSMSNDQHPQNIVYDTPGTYDVSLTSFNINGSTTELKSGYITVNASGIALNLTDESVTIFPNPNNGTFVIKAEFQKDYLLKIYNTLGAEVLKQKVINSETVNIKTIALEKSGIYQVVMLFDGKTIVRKVLIY